MSHISHVFHDINHISYHDMDSAEIIRQIREEIRKRRVRLIVLNTHAVLPEDVVQYMVDQEEQGIEYLDIEAFLEIYLDKSLLPHDKPSEELGLFPYTPLQYGAKRSVDYLGALVIAFFASPFMLYAAYRIKRESPGPIFFRQRRVGLHGKEFECIKFRSMHINAEEEGAQFAEDDDPRAFEFGKTIRKYKVDEFPQMWNVVRGDMHLVGPRPERPIWVKEFIKSIPHYNSRHMVAPGVTGWAQIKYHYGRGEVDARQKLMYDLYYIKNWKLRFEMGILWKTFRYLLQQKQA